VLQGARVIAAAGGPDRVERSRELADTEVIDYGAMPAFADQVRALAPDGISVYVETAGNPAVWQEALRTLARRARVAVCGAHGGPIVEVDLSWLFRNRISILGCSGSTLAAFRDVLALAGEGKVRPSIHEVLPLDRAREAYATLMARGNRGKIVLEVSAD
jgi:NADPH:quinone reductase-like Zn-dependent oxidoreductase